MDYTLKIQYRSGLMIHPLHLDSLARRRKPTCAECIYRLNIGTAQVRRMMLGGLELINFKIKPKTLYYIKLKN
jgi:hypothetical protein